MRLGNTRTVPCKTGKSTDIIEVVTNMISKVSLGYNHIKAKKKKRMCEHCGGQVRRDGFAAHRRSGICARKRKKYDKKANDMKKVPCNLCGKEVCKSKMKRHQRGSRCKPSRIHQRTPVSNKENT